MKYLLVAAAFLVLACGSNPMEPPSAPVSDTEQPVKVSAQLSAAVSYYPNADGVSCGTALNWYTAHVPGISWSYVQQHCRVRPAVPSPIPGAPRGPGTGAPPRPTIPWRR